jgi:hypothetical protein
MSKYPKWLGLSVIAFVLVVAVAVVDAQQPKKIPPIGYLSPVDPASEFARFEAMRLALRDRQAHSHEPRQNSEPM